MLYTNKNKVKSRKIPSQNTDFIKYKCGSLSDDYSALNHFEKL